ncbi:hypothetical protein OH799_31860 [Nocardia sp. NBC_00881]|uniref:hypothetical protein n=1 Tax=Nocardia sp. NBC_00881 TaxID=2975995 RepID=UPI00386FCB52|nr:hypothetical protein OH799_31860 [Nocardia sp. NBC_00881]
MTGSDPTYISAMEHFESMRHEEIYAKAQQIDAAQVLRASAIWLEAAGTLTTSFPLTRDSVDRVLNSTEWKGATADAAYVSARSFAASVDELAAVLGQVGARLGGVAAAAEAVKLAVAPPGNSGPISTVAKLLEAAHVINAQMAQEALRQEAVLAMNMVYKPAYTLAGTSVPALPTPPQASAPNSQFAPQAVAPAEPGHSTPAPVRPDGDQSTPNTPQPAPSAPESRAPSQTPAPPTQQQQTPDSPPTQQVPPTQQAPSNPQAPSTPPTQQTPSPQPSPQIPEPAQPPVPQPAPPTQPPHPTSPPAPQIPQPAPPPPNPGPAGPPVQLPGPGDQPGVTGPVQEHPEQVPTTNQPGVVPY